MQKWQQKLSSRNDLYQYMFKDLMEKNATLVTVVQIAHDAFNALAKETDPEKITILAKATVESMTKIVEKMPAKTVSMDPTT